MPESGIFIGLDIDEKSVKFVKIKQTNSDISLLKYAVRDVPASENKISAVSDILKELFKGEKPDTDVYTCSFGTNVSLKRISVPVMPDEEIPEALKWEAKNLVPFPIENAVVDFYKIGKTTEKAAEKYDLMFAVAGEDLIKFLNGVSKESNIKFSGISLMPLSLCSILKHSKKCEPDKVNAIIDIGAEAASINLFKGDILQFTREISVAGDSLTKAMTGLLVADQWQLNLTYEQAEDIKKKYGIPKKDTNDVTDNGIPLIHIYEMMAPTLRRLQNEILRSFDYFKEEFREEKIDSIYLTGGSSSLKNLEEYLTNALGTKVETVDPLESVKVDPASGIDAAQLKEIAPRLTLALGLALEKGGKINFRRAKEKPGKARINIDEILKTIKIPVNVNVLALAGVAVIVMAVSYYIYLSNVSAHYKKELSSKQQILTEVKALVERRSILEQIAREETHVREMLSQIIKALPAGILLTDLVYDNGKRQIWLSGESRDTETIGLMLKSFEDSPNFTKTILIEARKAVLENVQKILFRLTFSLT